MRVAKCKPTYDFLHIKKENTHMRKPKKFVSSLTVVKSRLVSSHAATISTVEHAKCKYFISGLLDKSSCKRHQDKHHPPGSSSSIERQACQ